MRDKFHLSLFLIIFLLILIAFSPVFSQETQSPTGADGSTSPFYISMGVCVDEPELNWPSYQVGIGASLLAGYNLDPYWAVQLDTEQFGFTDEGDSLYNFRASVEVKYTFNGKGWQSVFVGKGWQSYLLVGSGIVFQSSSPSGGSATNFDALWGLGLQWDLALRTHLFVEAKYNYIVSQTTTFTDIPLTVGLWVGL